MMNRKVSAAGLAGMNRLRGSKRAIDGTSEVSTQPKRMKDNNNDDRKDDDDDDDDEKTRPLSILSWNINGIADEQPSVILRRVNAISADVTRRQPTVVLLQEVTIPTQNRFVERLRSCYKLVDVHHQQQQQQRYPYFCAMFIRHGNDVIAADETPYPSTCMGRSLLALRMNYNTTPLLIMTSHFESEKTSSEERLRQFNVVLERMNDFMMEEKQSNGIAIFAGDTNLREAEAKKALKGKANIIDAWIAAGSCNSNRFTWDCKENTSAGSFFRNQGIPSLPRARYDRIFICGANDKDVETFKLTGTQPMHTDLWLSDHFGVETSLRVL